tara:strand:- start:65 stop:397 length:333 start_codon:yes stop_codon:yes gene_type:complete
MKKLLLSAMSVAMLCSCSKDDYEVSPMYLEQQLSIEGDYITYYVINAKDMVNETLVATYEGNEYTTNEMPQDNGDVFMFPITYPNLAVTLDSNIPRELITFKIGNYELGN